ncbi:hypothetical protein TNCV_2305631 [Trichonephila clavipes]|nr:hypothetical protein TNCV_2305631 [Trichonephila clavipes]
MQRGASRRFNRVPSSSKGRTRVGTVQKQRSKKETLMEPSMKREDSKAKQELATGQARIGDRPKELAKGQIGNRRQTKYEMDTNQI